MFRNFSTVHANGVHSTNSSSPDAMIGELVLANKLTKRLHQFRNLVFAHGSIFKKDGSFKVMNIELFSRSWPLEKSGLTRMQGFQVEFKDPPLVANGIRINFSAFKQNDIVQIF